MKVWLVWDCDDLQAVCTSQNIAEKFKKQIENDESLKFVKVSIEETETDTLP